MDKSTDMMDITQLAIFIREVNSNMPVSEEILDIKSMQRQEKTCLNTYDGY